MYFNICIFLFFIAPFCLCADLAEQVNQKILPELEKALEQNLEKLTLRKDVNIELLSEINENNVKIFLSQRSERDTVFQLYINNSGDVVQIKATVLHPQEEEILQKVLSDTFTNRNLQIDCNVGCIAWGIVNQPLINVYVLPKEEAGDNLATQLFYGTPVTILEVVETSGLLRVQNHNDNYIGWIALRDIKMVRADEWMKWISKPPVFNNQDFIVGEVKIPTGGRFAFESEEDDFVQVSSFDGSKYRVAKEKFILNEDIITTARKFLPQQLLATQQYLWGGSSSPQLDCSGFVQLTYKMHNTLLPRDADQQYQYSQNISLEDVRPGDLIFFSRHGKHPTHVGIHLGNNLYIHCSASGSHSGVKINDLQGNSEYDKYLREIYYASGRIQENE